MDRYGWIIYMNQLSNVCGTSPVKNHILLFGGHVSHFKNGALIQMIWKNIWPFVLKPGDSINDQPNDNDPNSKLKYLYNVAKSVWVLKYGTEIVSPHYMSFVLVEAWYDFNISAGNIIRDSFAKTRIPPLTPPESTTNTQACSTFIQVYYGSKAEEINNISR